MEQIGKMTSSDTICAVSTPAGTGGIAVVRVSGNDAVATVAGAWKGRDLNSLESHRATLGNYVATDGSVLDQGVATVFRAPRSFTGEDVVEISVHGSKWIQREVLADLVRRGARPAGRGEFTQRAFLNGRLDLAQAEGVADLIAASSRAAHRLAITQTRGRFSNEFNALRDKLIEFASLLELELDFSEEDVEFADRQRLKELAALVLGKVERLAASYSSGAVLKEGVPVVIAGVPNAGKSSLLNLLLGDEKAIVTDIPGTTRDVIEDTAEIDGILYRFSDTAGLRESSDAVEAIGVERARAKLRQARIVIWVIDPSSPLDIQLGELKAYLERPQDSGIVILSNKSDLYPTVDKKTLINATGIQDVIPFSAKTGDGLDELLERLKTLATDGFNPEEELIVTNARHYEALTKGASALRRAIDALDQGISGDFIAQDVREATSHLGEITGLVTTPDLLSSIFSRFCIGK